MILDLIKFTVNTNCHHKYIVLMYTEWYGGVEYTVTHQWRPEDNFGELMILPSGSWDMISVVRLGDNYLHPLSHLNSPNHYDYFIKIPLTTI